MKKYAVFNPADGLYTQVDTIEEAVAKSAEIACAFFLEHTHNNPFSVVQIAENGDETWYLASGEMMDSPAQIQAKLEAQLRKAEAFVNAGVMPVTTL